MCVVFGGPILLNSLCLHPQEINIEASDLCRPANIAFGSYVYSELHAILHSFVRQNNFSAE
jgi:hypothetical protein